MKLLIYATVVSAGLVLTLTLTATVVLLITPVILALVGVGL